ncbi:G1 family glutamic endopeptidase [Amycolatopsis sp. NPDC004772]
MQLAGGPAAAAQNLPPTSPLWSGYVVTAQTGSPRVTGAHATFTVPKVTCPKKAAEIVWWVGIDGAYGATLAQVGLGATCSGHGGPTYYLWWEQMPNRAQAVKVDHAISPGDGVSLDICESYGCPSRPNTPRQFQLSAVVTPPLEQTDPGYWSDLFVKQINYTTPQVTGECIVERPTIKGKPTGTDGQDLFPQYSPTDIYCSVLTSDGVAIDLAKPPAGYKVNKIELRSKQSGNYLTRTSAPRVDPVIGQARSFTSKWLAAK